MNRDELVEWFQTHLNRQPDPSDYYKAARDLYVAGAYSRAQLCLQHYVGLPSTVAAGRHLLAYCYLNLGETERALREFKRCAKEGYHEDWQMVVELTVCTLAFFLTDICAPTMVLRNGLKTEQIEEEVRQRAEKESSARI